MEPNQPTPRRGVVNADLGGPGHELEWVITGSCDGPAEVVDRDVDAWLRAQLAPGTYANRGTRLEVFDPAGPSAELIDLFHQAFSDVTITIAGAPLSA